MSNPTARSYRTGKGRKRHEREVTTYLGDLSHNPLILHPALPLPPSSNPTLITPVPAQLFHCAPQLIHLTHHALTRCVPPVIPTWCAWPRTPVCTRTSILQQPCFASASCSGCRGRSTVHVSLDSFECTAQLLLPCSCACCIGRGGRGGGRRTGLCDETRVDCEVHETVL